MKTAKIETFEAMILMSGSSVELDAVSAPSDEFSLQPSSAPNAVESFDESDPMFFDDSEEPRFMTFLNDLFGQPAKRRKGAIEQHHVTHEVELVEPRLLLSATMDNGTDDSAASGSTETSETDAIPTLEYNSETRTWSIEGTLAHINDGQQVRLVLEQPTSLLLFATKTGEPGEHPQAPYVELINEDLSGSRIELNAYEPVGVNLEAGVHFFQVNGNPNFQGGEFRLTAEVSDTPFEEDDFPDRLPADSPVTEYDDDFGGWKFQGRLHHRADVDLHRFEIEQVSVVIGDGVFASMFIDADGRQARPNQFGLIELGQGTWYMYVTNWQFTTNSADDVSQTFQSQEYSREIQLLERSEKADDHDDFVSPRLEIVNASGDDPVVFAGTLDHDDDRDFFQLEVDERSVLDFRNTVDRITLYNSYGNELNTVRNGEYELEHGTYYVEVTATRNSLQEYHVAPIVSTLKVDADDHGDLRDSSATPIVLSDVWTTELRGFFEAEHDDDVFRLTLDEDRVISLEVNDHRTTFQQLRRPTVAVRNSDGVYQSGGYLESGDYYVEVSWVSGLSSQSYSIDLSLDDHQQPAHLATALQPDGEGRLVGSGVINSPSDIDAFRLDLNSASVVQFDATGADGAIPSLRAYALHSPEVVVDVNNSTVLGEGWWIIEVRSHDGSMDPDSNTIMENPLTTGQYHLSVKATALTETMDDHPDQIGTDVNYVGLISVESPELGTWTFNGNLEDSDDTDVFRFPVFRRSIVTVAHSAGAYRIVSSSGEEPVWSAPGKTVLSSGTWYLMVESSGDREPSDYTVQVSISLDDHEDLPSQFLPPLALEHRQELAGVLEDAEDSDVFSVWLNNESDVVMTGSQDSPSMKLWNADEQFVQDVQYGETIRLGRGTWYIQVHQEDLVTEQEYSIELQATVVEGPDDQPSHPSSEIPLTEFDGLNQAWTFEGEISQINDRDVFSFRVDSPSIIVFDDATQSIQIESNTGQSAQRIAPNTYQLPAEEWFVFISGSPAHQSGVYTVTGTIVEDISTVIPDGPTGATDYIQIPPDVPVDLTEPLRNAPAPVPIVISESSDATINWDHALGMRIFNQEGVSFTAGGTSGEAVQRLAAGTWFVEVSDAQELDQNFALSLQVASVYTDHVELKDVPSETIAAKPVFRWGYDTDATEYEIFVGRRGETEAVFRTRGLTEDSLQVPEALLSGEYTVWLRKHHGNGLMSRWGPGHDFAIAARPELTIEQNRVQWTPVTGATRYEVWANHVDEFGTLVEEKIVHRADMTGTEFSIPQEWQSKSLTWWVRGISDSGDSNSAEADVELSAWSTVKYTTPPTRLEAPSHVLFTVPTGIPRLNWADVQDASEYEVFVGWPNSNRSILRERVSGTSIDLSAMLGEYNPDEHRIWIRAIGTGKVRSAWVEAVEPELPNPLAAHPAVG